METKNPRGLLLPCRQPMHCAQKPLEPPGGGRPRAQHAQYKHVFSWDKKKGPDLTCPPLWAPLGSATRPGSLPEEAPRTHPPRTSLPRPRRTPPAAKQRHQTSHADKNKVVKKIAVQRESTIGPSCSQTRLGVWSVIWAEADAAAQQRSAPRRAKVERRAMVNGAQLLFFFLPKGRSPKENSSVA